MTSAIAQVVWEKTLAGAVKKALAARKPIFVDFYAEWCGPCKMLEQNVFTDARVKRLLSHAICLRIDVDQNQSDAARFKVSSIPRLLLLSSDGRRSLWDTIGYREADEFLTELGEAMNVKPGAITATKAVPIAPALAKVQGALANGTFGQLKTSDPATVKSGLYLLVEKLGAFKESDFKPVAALLQRAGRDALPALVEGMAHKALAVRVGAYKVVQATLSKEELKSLTFDPWASATKRAGQLAAWRHIANTG